MIKLFLLSIISRTKITYEMDYMAMVEHGKETYQSQTKAKNIKLEN